MQHPTIFSWNWAAEKLLSEEGRKMYEKAKEPFLETYIESVKPHSKVYAEVRIPLLKFYLEARAPHMKAHEEAKARTFAEIYISENQ